MRSGARGVPGVRYLKDGGYILCVERSHDPVSEISKIKSTELKDVQSEVQTMYRQAKRSVRASC